MAAAEIDPAELAQEAAKRARNAAMLALLALAVAVAVLAIDNGIKKAILDESAKARDLIKQAHKLAVVANQGQSIVVDGQEAGSGQEAAVDAGAVDSAGVDGSGVLVDAPGSPAAADHDAGPGQRAPARGPDGKFTGARGDG